MLTLTQDAQIPQTAQLAAGGGEGPDAQAQPGAGNDLGPPAWYLANFYTGQLPASRGKVATAFSTKGSPAMQRDNAEALYQFLLGAQNNLRELNEDDTLLTALVLIPGLCKVALVYGMGFGQQGLVRQSEPKGSFWLSTVRGEGSLDQHKQWCLKQA